MSQLRLKRLGRKRKPFYRVVAIDHKEPRYGEPLEELGWYNPLSKEVSLKGPSIKYWLSVGATPTDTVRNLLRKALLIDQGSDSRK